MNQVLVVSFVVICCTAVVHTHSEFVSVNTPVGVIKGVAEEVDVWGHTNTVETYLGIPYAEAPTGGRRFKKPVPKSPFHEPFLAKEFGKVCFALDFPYNPWETSEDCLFMNVYVPTDGWQRQSNFPVMVWIHGGGFVNGASNIYQFERLSSFGEVIIVTLNYRLAVFGFYSTEDGSSPGNYVLWDQHLAIKWVNDNIQGFGGDPERVTIFGESAGSASVIYQSLYAGNKGLFQWAIAQSGSITSSWAFLHHSGESARHLGNLLGCNTSDSSVMTDCIRYMSAIRINETINDPSNGYFSFPGPVGPTVDGDFVKEDSRSSVSDKDRAFLASLDLTIGMNEFEGAMFVCHLIEDAENFDPTHTYFSESFMPIIASAMFKSPIHDDLKKAITSLYIGAPGSLDPMDAKKMFVSLGTDTAFAVSSTNTIALHAKLSSNNSFFYNLFTAPSHHVLETPSWADGANHGDDLLFVGGFPEDVIKMSMASINITYTPADWETHLSKAIMTAW